MPDDNVPTHPMSTESDMNPEGRLFYGEPEYQMTSDMRPRYGEPEYKRSNAVPTREEEMDNLARLIYAEGDSVTENVKAMLGSTVRNRVREPDFPDTYTAVIYQGRSKNGKWIPQYSGVGSDLWRKYDDPEKLNNDEYRSWRESREVAQGIYEGKIPDKTDGAIFFHSIKLGMEKGFFKRAVEDGTLIKTGDPVEGITFLKPARPKLENKAGN